MNLTQSADRSRSSDLILSTLDERSTFESEFQNMMVKRDQAGQSKKAQRDKAEGMKTMLESFRSLSKRLTSKLSSENSNANAVHAAKLRKEKIRLQFILQKTAQVMHENLFFFFNIYCLLVPFFGLNVLLQEIKSTGSCPTLFKTIQDEKTRESRHENTLRYVQVCNCVTLSSFVYGLNVIVYFLGPY